MYVTRLQPGLKMIDVGFDDRGWKVVIAEVESPELMPHVAKLKQGLLEHQIRLVIDVNA